MNMLKLAKDAGVKNPILNAEIEDKMLRLIVDEDRYEEIKAAPPKDAVIHTPVTNAVDLVTHLREMVQAGYTDEEMLALHPELEGLFSQPGGFEPIVGPVE